MKKKRVALATYSKSPDLTADDHLVVDHLRERQIEPLAVAWDSGAHRWADFDGVILRSCWDYHLRPEEFLSWVRLIEKSGVPLWNPARVVEWNMDKIYLRDLAARGVPVVPTVCVEEGTSPGLKLILEEQGWERAVVKPAISATAFQTWLTSVQGAVQTETVFRGMLKRSGVIVQRFVDEVQTKGEWSFIFFGNEYSHAVLKRARAGDFRVQEEFGGSSELAPPGDSLIEQAQRVVDLMGEELLFIRIDGVDVKGELWLMELELIEPVLFLSLHPSAPHRFADAIAARMRP
jgi:glutathione synthase/RimK-type ligase-like ATP-grasp enzyme